MEELGIRPSGSQGREPTGEGSADLERLLQTAEAENLQLLKLIDTEREKSTAFQNQIEDTIKHSEVLEESTKQLDVQAKQLHNKFKQNREICESLRKTALVLDEHEEALRKKLETVTLQQQTQTLQQKKVMEKYEKMWEKYFKKYESLPLAIELSQIKHKALNSETCIKETTGHITKIQTQIIEMEVEKTHIQEYLQGNSETATECIIKMAELYLDIEKSANATREKLSELNVVHAGFSAPTQPGPQVEHEILHQEPANGRLVIVRETQDIEESGMHRGHQEDIVEVEEIQCDDSQLVGNRPGLADNEQQLHEKDTADMATVVSENQITLQQRPLSTYHKMLSYHQQPPSSAAEMNGTTECLQSNSEPMSSNSGQNNGSPEMIATQAPPSYHPEEQTDYVPTDAHNVPQVQEDPPVSSSSQMPTTPISGSATPVRQSGTGTPVIQSPLDLNQHMRFIKQVTKSPGEGFMYHGRSMYKSHQVQVAEPAERNEPDQRNEPEIIYGAPLNDQPHTTFNYFQPFTQPSENTNQNIFQTNTHPSPKRNGSMFFNTSPAKSGAASPQQNFSFGPGATSPSPSESNFMSSSSPGGFFARNQAASNNDSFNSGFSLFGAGSSPGNSDSGGFSFSFGAKSPSKSSDNSGFSLF